MNPNNQSNIQSKSTSLSSPQVKNSYTVPQSIPMNYPQQQYTQPNYNGFVPQQVNTSSISPQSQFISTSSYPSNANVQLPIQMNAISSSSPLYIPQQQYVQTQPYIQPQQLNAPQMFNNVYAPQQINNASNYPPFQPLPGKIKSTDKKYKQQMQMEQQCAIQVDMFGSNNAQQCEQFQQCNQINSFIPPNKYYGKSSLKNNVFFEGIHQNSKPTLNLLNKKQEDKNKQVVAVIVTINSGGSYDHLFASVEQKSAQGTRVLVYEASSQYIENLIKAYKGDFQDQTVKQMMIHINKLHPDCVVFNWECCGAYASQQFCQGKQKVFEFLKIIIDKGHMAMFSDFSLKALIADWNLQFLGPNPFIKFSQTSTPIEMKFKAGELKECPSAQLQIVGEMAEGGSCHIQVLGGTICYTINPNNLNHQFYKLQVLSVASTTPIQNKKHEITLGQFKGSACHALLTYPSGGMILTSMGHWIELMKIDTSQKKLFEVAQQNFGQQYAAQMKMQYANLNVNEQKSWVSKNAVSFVQNQAPCSNMSKKMKNKY